MISSRMRIFFFLTILLVACSADKKNVQKIFFSNTSPTDLTIRISAESTGSKKFAEYVIPAGSEEKIIHGWECSRDESKVSFGEAPENYYTWTFLISVDLEDSVFQLQSENEHKCINDTISIECATDQCEFTGSLGGIVPEILN